MDDLERLTRRLNLGIFPSDAHEDHTEYSRAATDLGKIATALRADVTSLTASLAGEVNESARLETEALALRAEVARLTATLEAEREGSARLREAAAVCWVPRGIGSNWNIPDLRTGTNDGELHPDCSGYVNSREEGLLAVAVFGGKAFLDYRPSEPKYVQVKVSCDERTLTRLIGLVQANGNYVTPAIVAAALAPQAAS